MKKASIVSLLVLVAVVLGACSRMRPNIKSWSKHEEAVPMSEAGM